MTTSIQKVTTKAELKKFIRFNYELYKNNPYSVPDLYDDMLNTFNPKKNAAFEFCEADYFLAYRGDEIVGRVAAIINHRANKTWNKKEVRFGWIDFMTKKKCRQPCSMPWPNGERNEEWKPWWVRWGLPIWMPKVCW